MPTGFFDLPRELRDQIYDELWIAGYMSDGRNREYWPVRMTTIYTTSPAYHCFSTRNWLHTNKTILREGQEQFHRKGFVHVHYRSGRRQGTFNIHEPPRVLSAYVARDLRLMVWAETHDAMPGFEMKAVAIETDVLERVKSLITGNEQLRELEIFVMIEGLVKGKEHHVHVEELLASVAAISATLRTFKLVFKNMFRQRRNQGELVLHLDRQLEGVEMEGMAMERGKAYLEARRVFGTALFNPLEVIWRRV